VLKNVIEAYATKIGIKLKQIYDAETLSAGMSLVASTGGFTLVPIYVQNSLLPSVVARPLHGEVPTIELVMGYNKSNTSALLKKFLLRADELAANGPQVQRSSIRTMKIPNRRVVGLGRAN
jgi:LysR family hca operon transcriptional activator